MFDVGRSMFDVHFLKLRLKSDIVVISIFGEKNV